MKWVRGVCTRKKKWKRDYASRFTVPKPMLMFDIRVHLFWLIPMNYIKSKLCGLFGIRIQFSSWAELVSSSHQMFVRFCHFISVGFNILAQHLSSVLPRTKIVIFSISKISFFSHLWIAFLMFRLCNHHFLVGASGIAANTIRIIVHTHITQIVQRFSFRRPNDSNICQIQCPAMVSVQNFFKTNGRCVSARRIIRNWFIGMIFIRSGWSWCFNNVISSCCYCFCSSSSSSGSCHRYRFKTIWRCLCRYRWYCRWCWHSTFTRWWCIDSSTIEI